MPAHTPLHDQIQNPLRLAQPPLHHMLPRRHHQPALQPLGQVLIVEPFPDLGMLRLVQRPAVRRELPLYLLRDGLLRALERDQSVVCPAAHGGEVLDEDVGAGGKPDGVEDCGIWASGADGGHDFRRRQGVVDDVGWGEGSHEGMVCGRGGGDDGVAGRDGVFDGQAAAGARAAVDEDFLIGIGWRGRTGKGRA